MGAGAPWRLTRRQWVRCAPAKGEAEVPISLGFLASTFKIDFYDHHRLHSALNHELTMTTAGLLFLIRGR